MATATQNTGRLIKDKQRAGPPFHIFQGILQRRLTNRQQPGFTAADRLKRQPLRLVRRAPGVTLHDFFAALPGVSDEGGDILFCRLMLCHARFRLSRVRDVIVATAEKEINVNVPLWNLRQ
jgi:hypothetical protein